MASKMGRSPVIRQLYHDQMGKCYYCWGTMELQKTNRDTRACVATREHLVKKAEGGTRKEGNIRLCCSGCNGPRQDIPYWKWRKIRRALLPLWPPCTYPPPRAKDVLKFVYRMWFDVCYMERRNAKA